MLENPEHVTAPGWAPTVFAASASMVQVVVRPSDSGVSSSMKVAYSGVTTGSSDPTVICTSGAITSISTGSTVTRVTCEKMRPSEGVGPVEL